MKWLSQAQRWLIEPHPDVKDPLQRQRSAILSLVLLIVPTFYLIFELILYSVVGDDAFLSNPDAWIASISIISLLLYGMTRTRYHTLTIWLTIIFTLSAIFMMHVTFGGNRGDTTLYYLATVIFAAGFICTTQQILVLLALSYSILVLLTLFPGLSSSTDFNAIGQVGLFMTIAGFITLGSRNVTSMLRRQQQQAEERLQGLFNAGGEAILILCADNFEITESNQTARMLFRGIADNLEGESFLSLLREESREKFIEYKSHPDGTPRLLIISQQSGTPLYVEARLSPYPSQEHSFLLLSLMDATEKINTYEALATSERRFQEVFNILTPFMALLDQDGKIIAVNDTAKEVLGLPLSHIEGRNIWSFVDLTMQSREVLRNLLADVLQGNLAQGKIIFENSRADVKIFDCTMQPRQAGSNEADVVILSARDITEETKLQERLHDIERRYEALFHRSEDAIFIFDIMGKILSANEQAANFLQTTQEDLVGNAMSRFIAPNEYPDTQKRLKALMKGEKVPVTRRTFITKEEEQVVGEVSAMSVYDQNGVMRYIQSIVRDMSRRDERERIKLQYNLVRARNAMMGEFITAASHHFRTPLTTIKASLYLLPRLENNPEKREEHLSVLNAEVERLERLLNDLLLVVRLQRTTTSEYNMAISLSTLVNDIYHRQSAKSTYNNHQWKWEIRESVETIQGNGEYIQRAMQNVLDNAIAYTPEGGRITVQTFEQDQWAVFEVLDTGIGIADEDIQRVGKDFFRADAAQERQHANPGLGLSIVRQIMHRHRGAMLIDSVPGQGTRVQLLWPTNEDWMRVEPEVPATLLGDPSPFTHASPEKAH